MMTKDGPGEENVKSQVYDEPDVYLVSSTQRIVKKQNDDEPV
mgnify:CR=1 FL=1